MWWAIGAMAKKDCHILPDRSVANAIGTDKAISPST